ncbi:zinc finger BED domain-containing protein RICESLEEPER 2-like protein [Tanacetum coccineum]
MYRLNIVIFALTRFPNMVGPMKEKLIKYFKKLPPVITCDVSLNPILNQGGVEILINNIAYDLGLSDTDNTYVSRQVSRFNAALDDMFQVYLNKYGSSASNIHFMHQAAGSSSCGSNASMQMYNLLVNENRKRARDILGWWKARESRFLILAVMARDLLSVQASTVVSESAFSVSGRVVSLRRTKLTPTSVEVCICLKDHLDGMERIQRISPLEGELEQVEENKYTRKK